MQEASHSYHINMISRWEAPSAVCMALEVESEQTAEAIFPMARLPTDHRSQHQQKEQMSHVLERHEKLFSDLTGRTSMATISIKTGETPPIHSPPYCLPHARKVIVKKEIEQMLRSILIEASTRWASPVLIPKNDGSLRLCVDYRKLNAVSSLDPFPMPRIVQLTMNSPVLTILQPQT